MSKKVICEVCGCDDVEILSRDLTQSVDLYTYKCKACESVVDMSLAYNKKQEKLAKQREKQERIAEEQRQAEEKKLEEERQRQEFDAKQQADSMGVAERIYNECSGKILEITASFTESLGFGTGFYISADGYILTNAHVVMQLDKASGNSLDSLADNIDGKNIITDRSASLELISADIDNDIALLKADKEGVEFLSLVSNEPKTGQDIFAIGNSKGEGMCILQGIISDACRKINDKNHIMFSATVTQGNSGGPLIDKNGDCIGMVVAKRQDAVSMNYAIPINTIKSFLEKAIYDEDLDLEI